MATHSPAGITDQQIRQKLLHQGIDSLSDAELLSIILRSGEGGSSAVELATRVLKHFGGSLVQAGKCELTRLRSVEQLGITRAAMVVTALELGRRCRASETLARETIQSDRDVIELFQPQLVNLPHEEFWVLYLNTSNRILERVRVSQGGVSGTVVDLKLVIKRAIERLASAIVLIHNHPSGRPLPSEEDNTITEKLVNAAALFDMQVMDHVIISSGGNYSFREQGFFDVSNS